MTWNVEASLDGTAAGKIEYIRKFRGERTGLFVPSLTMTHPHQSDYLDG